MHKIKSKIRSSNDKNALKFLFSKLILKENIKEIPRKKIFTYNTMRKIQKDYEKSFIRKKTLFSKKNERKVKI